MKNCKSCKKEIDEAASKCPFCQSYQIWYKSPQIYSFLFIIPIMGFSFWNIKSLDSKSYTQFKDKISFEIVSNRIVDKNIEFIYKVKNLTEYKWDSIKYQMVGYDSAGKIISTKNGGVYEWVIQANSESLISVDVPNDDSQNIKTWKFEIIDLRTSRY